MKKLSKYLFCILFPINFALNGTFGGIGVPEINHFGPPQLYTAFGYEHPQKSILNVIPENLLKAVLASLDIKGTNPKNDFQKAIENIKLTFYDIIWTKLPITEKWDIDRNYFYGFHNILNKWLGGSSNFQRNVLMGLFEPNGVQKIDLPKTDVELRNPMPFNELALREVIMAPTPAAKKSKPDGPWLPHEINTGPKNAHFHLADGRSVATFWTAIISPDKKNIAIIFNTIIDRSDIENTVLAVPESKTGNFKPMITVLNDAANKLKREGKESDANALLKTVNVLTNVQVQDLDPKLLFATDFVDKVKAANGGRFPLEFLTADPSTHIYQVGVLSQMEGVCPNFPVIGNTCGRHSFKNSIAGILEFLAYKNADIASFIQQARNLTTKSGKLSIESETELTAQAACLFKTINEYLKTYRLTTDKKTDIEEDTLPVEEVRYIIENTEQIAKEKCKISAEINNKMITAIPTISNILNISSPTALAIDFIDSIKIGKQIALSHEPHYIHSFILAVMGQHHWINVVVFRDSHGILNYVAMDSLGHPNWPEVKKLKELLENFDVTLLFKNALLRFKESKLRNVDRILGFFNENKVNDKISVEGALPSLKIKIANEFIKNLAALLIQAKELSEFEAIIKRVKPDFKTDFNLGDLKVYVNKILTEKKGLLREIPNLKQISEIFGEFSTTEDINKLMNKISLSEIKDPIVENLIKEIRSKENEDIRSILDVNGKSQSDVLSNIDRDIENHSKTLLMIAAEKGRKNLVQLILNYNADPFKGIRDNETTRGLRIANFTALNFAMRAGHRDIAKLILNAAIRKQEAIIKILDANHIKVEDIINNINLPIGSDKKTIFILAAERHLYEFIKMLFGFGGVDPFVKDNTGKTALDIVKEHKVILGGSDFRLNKTIETLEKATKAIEKRREEERKKAEEARLAEEKRKAEEHKKAIEKAKKLEEEKKIEEARNAIITSIFEQKGYRDRVQKYNDLLESIDAFKIVGAKEEALKDIKLAEAILVGIEKNANQQISNSTPLRNYFAKAGLYPDTAEAIIDKDKKAKVYLEKHFKLLNESLKNR